MSVQHVPRAWTKVGNAGIKQIGKERGISMGKSASNQSDRRKEVRVTLSFPVRYSFQYATESGRYTIEGKGEAICVSSSGICLQLDTPAVLLHGAPMNFTLFLPKEDSTILAKGWVRWSEAFDGATRTGALIEVTKDKRRFQQSIHGSNGAKKKGK